MREREREIEKSELRDPGEKKKAKGVFATWQAMSGQF